jgi:hypothetical protein
MAGMKLMSAMVGLKQVRQRSRAEQKRIDLGDGYGGLLEECAPGQWYVEAWGSDQLDGGTFDGDREGALACLKQWCRDIGWSG